MEKAKQAVDSVVDGAKKLTVSEKKPKAKKEKGGVGGADVTVSWQSPDFETAKLNGSSLLR